MNRRSNVMSPNALLEGEVIPAKESLTLSVDEYKKYSEDNGRIMGRMPDQKTALTVEELRILINENWTEQEVMDKHGIDAEELKQIVWKLSKDEQRDRPIRFGKSGK